MALSYLRDNLKSLQWILWGVIFVLFGLVFFEWGGFNPQMQGQGNDVAATVGDQTISFSEFERSHREQEARFRQAFGDQFNSDLARQFNLPQRALDSLIDRRILLMEANQIGLQIADEEIRDAILEVPFFKDESGRFIGSEEYRTAVRRGWRMSIDEFEDLIRDDLLIQKLDTVLASTAYISESAVEKAYRDQNELAKIRYVELPANKFANLVAETAELERYFAERQDDYELPEQRVVDYLLVDTIKLRREIEIPEEELRAYFDDHPEEFTREEQVRARHILFKVTPERPDGKARDDLRAVRRRIEGGADFSELARELSEDEGSAAQGGSLGYFGRGAMIKAFEDAAFGAQVSEVIGPLKTDFGYHLIEVQDHRQGGPQPFEQVQAVILSRLVGERVEEIAAAKAQDVSQRLTGGTAEGEDPLATLAEEEDLTFQTTAPFGQDETIPGVGRAPAFNSAVFALDEAAVSEPVKIPRGWIIARLAEIVPPRVPELSEVENDVRQAVEQQKRGDAAHDRLREARANLADGADLETLAAELEVEIQESEKFARFGNIAGLTSSRKVIETALAMEEGDRSDPITTDDGALMFEVTERKSFDRAQFEEEKEATRSSQEGQRVNQLRASLIELRKQELEPSYNPQVFANFDIQAPAGSPGS